MTRSAYHPDMERIVQLEHRGVQFTFRIDDRPPLQFWRVEWEGKSWPSPVSVVGGEEPEFFRKLAEAALETLKTC